MKETDFQVLAIDETHFWNEDFIKKHDIKKIETVYLFDKGQTTNCCELMPSYWLEPVYPLVTMNDDENEDNRNEAEEEVMSEFLLNQNGMYVHCSDIDKMKTEDANFLFEEDEDREYEYIFDDVVEYCQGNHPI